MAEMKPKIDFADLRWLQALESVKKNGVVIGYKVVHINDDPIWIWVKSKAGNRMVRKGDEFIHALLKH